METSLSFNLVIENLLFSMMANFSLTPPPDKCFNLVIENLLFSTSVARLGMYVDSPFSFNLVIENLLFSTMPNKYLMYFLD